ncbi:MAG TPA: hypothetical protein VHQ45_04570 [Gemmatimonadaceae bacterium]|jgi:hypothetical protein|nr:hypothetical protein [Gemmatimonadaceae bacterium]
MSAHHLALLLGLFAAPALMLQLGHRLQRRSARERGMFWGLVIGHSLGAAVASVALFLPPEFWALDASLRTIAAFWGMLAGGALGLIAGRVLAR